MAGTLGLLSDFFVFDPVEDGPYPAYLQPADLTIPGTAVTTNALGWRGPEIDVVKPADTIRIAFVGSSTTVSAAPISHPEFIGHWLNVWAKARHLPVRFEIVNAGETGIDSHSIAAIVRQRIVELNPDLVIYYEGANQFAPGRTMKIPADMPTRPTTTFRPRTLLWNYSAVVRRGVTMALKILGGEGEPPKPPYPTVWPPDRNEFNPDVTQSPLPMDLELVVSNLDSMRTALAARGSELAMSSFIWMVYPGMRIDIADHWVLYEYLNNIYWPATYAHLRRMADYQNLVFKNYAKLHGLPFFDVARNFPPDLDLFGDAIHMFQDGLRLQAWVYLQQLIPVIQERLESKRWPRTPAGTPHYVASRADRLLGRAAILASCR